jgi:hypothetical protein
VLVVNIGCNIGQLVNSFILMGIVMELNDFRKKVSGLSEIYQMAILDMTVHIQGGQEVKPGEPKVDVNKAHYIVGVAGMISFLLETLASHGESFYDANKEKANKLLQDASSFASSLQAEGYGVGRVLH